MSRPTAILIAGPTASGKSRLALALADRLGGVVINADSMQVYAELHILSARPSEEETSRAPHRLYGHVRGSEGYSAGRYVKEAAEAISTAQNESRLPIIVGGTGLYFKALLEGLSPIPAIPGDIRMRWRMRAQMEGPGVLHRLLAERDPETASRLLPTDPQRIVRALEVLEATGRSLSQWQRQPGTPVLRSASCLRLVIVPERSELYRRCDFRFDLMMREGALDEVAVLHEQRLDTALPIMRALGVRPLLQHIEGRCELEAAVEAGKAETRHYVKRQMTWLNRHMMSWIALSAQDIESFPGGNLSFIDFPH